MSEWQKIKQLNSADGLRRIYMQRGIAGLFRFAEETYVTEDGYTFWNPTWQSGLYDSAEAAERAAQQETPWLRDENSK